MLEREDVGTLKMRLERHLRSVGEGIRDLSCQVSRLMLDEQIESN